MCEKKKLRNSNKVKRFSGLQYAEPVLPRPAKRDNSKTDTSN